MGVLRALKEQIGWKNAIQRETGLQEWRRTVRFGDGGAIRTLRDDPRYAELFERRVDAAGGGAVSAAYTVKPAEHH